MTTDTKEDSSLDNILTEIGGFGLFQVITYILLCIPNILSATYAVNYMISANTLDYRCKVPECDVGENNRDIPYDQKWLENAIPSSNDQIDSCTHFALKNETTPKVDRCNADMFDSSRTVECSEYVYASNERNIQTEFNIHCSDSYELAFVGTANNIARLISLPLAGLLSDRFGRLTVVVIGMFLSSVFGLIKSFSVNYPMYITFEFFESFVGASNFEGSYVLAIEWVNSKYRILGGTIISLSYAVGEMLLGFVAMYVPDFRVFTRIFSIPGLLVFIYFWLVPESVRWLLVTGRIDRAINILKRIARTNRKKLSGKLVETIKLQYSNDLMTNTKSSEENHSVIQSFCMIFKSKKLSLRFLNCCYLWAASCLGYFGLSLSATHIPGANRYISFIFVMGAEIPGVLLAQALLNRMKRRLLLIVMLCLAAISIIISPFIPEEYNIVVLILFLLGKSSMTCAYTSLFVFTAEQWPTNIRTTIMNSCLMVGRMGAMMAPMTVALDTQYHSLSALLFGVTSFIAAALVLFSPETYSKKLPDTILEAKNL